MRDLVVESIGLAQEVVLAKENARNVQPGELDFRILTKMILGMLVKKDTQQAAALQTLSMAMMAITVNTIPAEESKPPTELKTVVAVNLVCSGGLLSTSRRESR